MNGIFDDTGAVVIGRNEGTRLEACLRSLLPNVAHVIYVDSGSTDGSTEAARALGVTVVDLDVSLPFTAARARNAGLARLRTQAPDVQFAQFIDGDCEMRDTWLGQAHRFLTDHSEIAVVCGRRRERYPEATLWNRLIDAEWDTPIGEALACGGDALMRVAALQEVDGYTETLIAGEEPDLCLRMRAKNWKIWRLDAEMTWHDANITQVRQWWQRSRRAGYTYIEAVMRNPGVADAAPNRMRLKRAFIWGLALPAVTVLGCLVTPWSQILLLAWPLQIWRLSRSHAGLDAAFLTLGKLPEAQGVLTYLWRRLWGKDSHIIEYKS